MSNCNPRLQTDQEIAMSKHELPFCIAKSSSNASDDMYDNSTAFAVHIERKNTKTSSTLTARSAGFIRSSHTQCLQCQGNCANWRVATVVDNTAAVKCNKIDRAIRNSLGESQHRMVAGTAQITDGRTRVPTISNPIPTIESIPTIGKTSKRHTQRKSPDTVDNATSWPSVTDMAQIRRQAGETAANGDEIFQFSRSPRPQIPIPTIPNHVKSPSPQTPLPLVIWAVPASTKAYRTNQRFSVSYDSKGRLQ